MRHVTFLVLLSLVSSAGVAQPTAQYDIPIALDCPPVCSEWGATVPRCTFTDPIPWFFVGYQVKRIVLTTKIAAQAGFQPHVAVYWNTTKIGEPISVLHAGQCTTTGNSSGVWTTIDTVTDNYTFDTGTIDTGVPGYVYGGTNQLRWDFGGIPIWIKPPTGTLTIAPPTPEYAIELQVSPDPSTSAAYEKFIPNGGAAAADIPLGNTITVQLVKKNRGPAGVFTSVPVFAEFSTPTNDISPALETTTNLFRRTTLVPVSGNATSGESITYEAVHRGHVIIKIVPSTLAGGSPVQLDLHITAPTALGTTHNGWDSRIIEVAHERGIPPQVIKGQINQESPDFNDTEYRYELCSSDYQSISNPNGARLIDTLPYSLYAFDAIRNDTQLAPTVDLRNRLRIFDRVTHARRFIRHDDPNVTAREIYDASDIWDPVGQHGERWSLNPCVARSHYLRSHSLEEFLDQLRFTAQTLVASSYGVMQVMYPTAINYHWSVPDPIHPGTTTQSPQYLRDTADNLAIVHGGSTFFGGHEDVIKYHVVHSPEPKNYDSQKAFFDSFVEPLRLYTGGGVANYGTNIINNYIYLYPPVTTSNIFH